MNFCMPWDRGISNRDLIEMIMLQFTPVISKQTRRVTLTNIQVVMSAPTMCRMITRVSCIMGLK